MQLIVEVEPHQLSRLGAAINNGDVITSYLTLVDDARDMAYHLIANHLVLHFKAQESQGVLNPNLFIDGIMELYQSNRVVVDAMRISVSGRDQASDILTSAVREFYPKHRAVWDTKFGRLPLFVFDETYEPAKQPVNEKWPGDSK